MAELLHAVRQSRFAPAQRPGRPVVAVNMVWLFARTTVKASPGPIDLGVPLTRPVLAAPPRGRQAAEPRSEAAGWPSRGRAPLGRSPIASATRLRQRPR